jgi:hypothetical protein
MRFGNARTCIGNTCASVMHECASKPFFIPVVHSPSGAVGHVAAPELPSQEGKVPSYGTRGSAGAHLGTEREIRGCETRGSTRAYLAKEVRTGAEGHVVASELTSARRQEPRPRDTWQHQISPQHGGEVRGHRTHGSVVAHLSTEARSEAAGHVAAPEPTSTGRCGPKLPLMW